MWTRRFGIVLILLIAGVVFLSQPARDANIRVLADAPVAAPSTSQTVFLPFISQIDLLKRDPLWRFGVDRVRRPLSAYGLLDILHMRLGWYIDFGATTNPETLNGMEYVPMIRLKQWKRNPDGTPTDCCIDCSYLAPAAYTVWPSLSQIQSIATSRPGMMWIVGNEMERIDWGGLGGSCGRQDEMLPELYAVAYHDVYTALKSADLTAQVAVGALVQPSPLRIKWMDRVLTEYKRLYDVDMPADAWTIHVYIYNEKSCDVYPLDCWGADIPAGLSDTIGTPYKIRDHKDFNKAAEMIVAWRAWMKANGYQNKPLLTPEYGVVLPEWVQDPELPGVNIFTPNQIRDSFMYPSFNYFLNHTDPNLGYPADGNRLMQRWAWWSMDYDDGVCELDQDTNTIIFYPDNTGNLFHSGLNPSILLPNCPFPAQGVSQFGNYLIQYVQTLPSGATKPYAPVRSAVAPSVTASPSTALKSAPESAKCSDSPQARAQFLRSLPSRNTPAGQQAWVTALSRLTAGAQICLP